MPGRALAIATLVAAVALACGNDHAAIDAADPVPGHAVDLLFVVEDNLGVTDELTSQYARSVAALFDSIGSGASLHVGVVTADLGTTNAMDPTHPAPPIGQPGQLGACVGSGDDGALRVYQALVTGNFLVDEPGTANFTGDLTDAVTEMLRGAGVDGCGITQHLAATARVFANPANAGFRRPDAALAIVVIADDDDCTVRDPAIFGSGSDLVPIDSRCLAYGVTCDQNLLPSGPKTNCRPRTDSYEDAIEPYVDAIRTVQPDGNHLVVGGVIGPPAPITIYGTGSAFDDNPCYGDNPIGAAGAGIRLAAWLSALGGSADSACASDDTASAQHLGQRIAAMLAR